MHNQTIVPPHHSQIGYDATKPVKTSYSPADRELELPKCAPKISQVAVKWSKYKTEVHMKFKHTYATGTLHTQSCSDYNHFRLLFPRGFYDTVPPPTIE